MTNENTPINAALDSDASQFFVGIRIRLLELGFGITLAPISLASGGGRPEFWGHQISSHAREQCSTPAIARRDPRVAEVIDLYCDGVAKDRSLDQGANVALPYLR
jgi:hypothetical protein